MNTPLIERAVAFALRAHGAQTRKGLEMPYLVHPVAVAMLLARYGFADEVIAAAILHDTLEDTPAEPADIKREFSAAVAALVAGVTHNNALSWDEKKKDYIEMIRRAPEEVKAISVADKIANAESLIAMHEAQGAAAWSHFTRGREKKLWFEHAMLAMLRESWQHPLVEEYAVLVARLDTLD